MAAVSLAESDCGCSLRAERRILDVMDESRRAAKDWVAGYLRAWKSNDPTEIGALFAEKAEYRFDAFTDPVVGREAIVAEWLRRQDAADSWTFEHDVVATEGDLVIVEGVTRYADGRVYSNLWLIRLAADKTATSFTEWWMDHANPS
tara:strand:- start:855 stop:1295 length:441 start_codon:yes stop_codon:yes gene_type:complete